MMRSNNRDLLVKSEWISDQELDAILRILRSLETPEIFCSAHELVDRNRIVSKKENMERGCFYYLRPFRFLINKN